MKARVVVDERYLWDQNTLIRPPSGRFVEGRSPRAKSPGLFCSPASRSGPLMARSTAHLAP